MNGIICIFQDLNSFHDYFISLFINLVAQLKDHLYENITVTYQPLSINKNKTINYKRQVIKIFEIKM